MAAITAPIETPATSRLDAPSRAHLRRAIERAGSLLPISGPITSFAFLNTLQALEDLPFDEGLQLGARLFGAEPYLSEERYREKLVRGRIRIEDLSAILREDLGEAGESPIGSFGTRYDVRLAMLRYPLRQGPPDEMRWFVAETDALTKLRDEASPRFRDQFIEETRHWVMRDVRDNQQQEETHALGEQVRLARVLLADILKRFDERNIEQWSEPKWVAFSLQALWRVCRHGVEHVEPMPLPASAPLRHRDLLLAAVGEDSDQLVNDLLIRFCAAFVDQGMAAWTLPQRELGFFQAFSGLYRKPGGPPDVWMRGLPRELARLSQAEMTPEESILESLELLAVPEKEWDDYITASLLALRGWAGMIWQMEVRGDRVPTPVPEGTTVEFLAVRLMLDRLALSYVARRHLGYEATLAELRTHLRQRKAAVQGSNGEQRAFLVFQLAQVLGWTPAALFRLSAREWNALVREIEAFSEIERRRIFQMAFERNFRVRALDAISSFSRVERPAPPSPRFQAVFCIDAREESFRRHLEEVAPDVETFGAAGFFGVAMYYRGAADAHFAALCPIVVRPQHWVVEDVVYTLDETHRRRAKTRRALGTASHRMHLGSRSIAGGAILTAGLGVLASIPLVARVLFPWFTSRIRRTADRFVAPPPMTRLRLERLAVEPGSEEDHVGFSVEEMADIGERMLREISFPRLARLVMFLGHGSFCLNNPHKSAYDCGACTGNAGGPNGRALAAILNDLRVREILAKRGLPIPTDTFFVGGLHNTSEDTVTFFDLDMLPKSHFRDFEAARDTLERACDRNAHERCRRFQSAPLNLSLPAARRHVEQRAEDLAQTRPEFGNATNAMCVVGRRERTRGLYLDRRAFLTSYDSTQDDAEHTVLARILSAVVPVCEGINMQYFLSYTDSTGWGCGTKLPHNVTSLLGVMDGAASDLRPGLPWQGVEIHEPLRCLFVIEATPEAMLKIMDRVEVVGRILRNGWAQLAVLDPNSNEIQVFRNNAFHRYQPENPKLPTAKSSIDWYRGWREHLDFAAIEDRGS